MKKHCSGCKEVKELTEFHKNKTKRDGLSTTCKVCASRFNKKYYKNKGEDHRKVVRERAKVLGEKLLDKLLEYLNDNNCIDCGENDPIVLQFDHRDGVEKKESVSFLLASKYGWETIKKEIDKCDVRCANCHLKRTAKQFNWAKHKRNIGL